MTWRVCILLILFGTILQHRAQAQGLARDSAPFIRGLITDRESGILLATGVVTLLGMDGRGVSTALADEDGRYLLRAPGPGEYRLRAECVGYHPQGQGPVTLAGADTVTVDFSLAPAPFLLDSILVSVRRRAQPLRAGEQLITGRLLDFESAEPIAQGLVRLLRETGESAASALSDDEGLFWLVSPMAGTYRLQGERIGYKTSTGPELHVMLGDTLSLDFYLSMEAIVLNPLVVRATARPLTDRYGLEGMEQFLRRYSIWHNQGDFLTRDSIARYERWVTSVGHMLGLTSMAVRTFETNSPRVTLRVGCDPAYFLNGSPLPRDQPLTWITPEMLEAVEVYAGPFVPADFGRPNRCGVVSMWTILSPDPAPPAPAWKKASVILGILGLGFLLIGF